MQKPAASGVGVLSFTAACALFTTSAVGCVERDPFSANDVAAADAFHASQAAAATRRSVEPAAGGVKVACRCDAEGGLHVQAPQGATVTTTSVDDGEDAAAEITMAEATAGERAAGTRLRRTVSLGFAGDGKLTQLPSRSAPMNAPEGPVVGASYVGFGYGRGVPVRGARYGGYGPSSGGHHAGAGGAGAGSAGGAGAASAGGGSRGSLIFSPHVHSSAASPGGHASGGGGHAGGGGRGPR